MTPEKQDKARVFARLHVKGSPLVLYNAWDAGSARAIRDAGAPAIATSSWAVAAAHGFEDGESIPLPFTLQIVARITATVDLPVTVDFEGGYSDDDDVLAANIDRLLELGVVGINFEDRIVPGETLYDTVRQARRIAAIRAAAEAQGVPLFINARTDLFFAAVADQRTLVSSALARAHAYADAGASGFFTPGLRDDEAIGELCARVPLPMNIMVMDGVSSIVHLAELGVARVSFGPGPFVLGMSAVETAARGVYAGAG